MFLTTNRVQSIDPAFKSRIHVSFTYPALSTEAKSRLWQTFILKATEQHHPRWLNVNVLKKLSSVEVNGREIKNITRVAHALALSEKRSMQVKDIFQGLRSLQEFERAFEEGVGKRQITDNQQVSSSKKAKLSEYNC